MSFYIGFSLRLLLNFVGRANSQAGFSNFLLFPLAAWGSRLPLSPVSNSGCTEAVLFWASSCGGAPYPVWYQTPALGAHRWVLAPSLVPESPLWAEGLCSQLTHMAMVFSFPVLKYTPLHFLSLATYFQLYLKNILSCSGKEYFCVSFYLFA